MKRARALGYAGLALAAYYLLQPGRSVATAVQDVQSWGTGTIRLQDYQAAAKLQIEAAFTAAGLRWAAPAAVANAWAESRLDTYAVGDNGHSVGLFQLNDCASCAGSGLSVAQRQDPAVNIARMIATAQASPAFLATRGRTHAEVTRAFAIELERCALCTAAGPEPAARVVHLRGLYGAATAEAIAA